MRVAVVGLGGRGPAHLKGYDANPGVRVVALCDVDTARLERHTRRRHDMGKEAHAFVDVRDLLARPDIDAISIATPNHWHSLLAIWACQAGKDVYVEKPVSQNIWEGRQEVAAAAKYSRIVQTGTQSRSRPDLMESVAWIRSGHLGRIQSVRGLCYKRRPSIGLTAGPQPVPPGVNYDLWLGPAPMAPPRRKQFHYDWHWFWPTGCGDLGNQGVHQMDVARWFLGDPKLAPHTLTVGGRLGYVDDAETPNTVAVVHDLSEAPLIFEVRGLPAGSGSETMDLYPNREIGTDIGVIAHCEGGTVVAANGSRYNKGAAETGADYGAVAAFDRRGKLVKKFDGSDNPKSEAHHFGNFIAAVRSRKTESLRAPIECGHLSSSFCHTANISYRLGAALPPDEVRERVRGNPSLGEAFGRMSEHLAANGVNLDKNRATLGLPLAVDPATETFLENKPANHLLTRHYRSPFVVPNLA